MSVNLYWSNDWTVCLEIGPGWTWGGLSGAVEEIETVLNAVEHSVCLIVDYHAGDQQCPENSIMHLRRIAERDSNQIDAIVIVNASAPAMSLLQLLQRTAKKLSIHRKFHFVDTMDAAHQLLNI